MQVCCVDNFNSIYTISLRIEFYYVKLSAISKQQNIILLMNKFSFSHQKAYIHETIDFKEKHTIVLSAILFSNGIMKIGEVPLLMFSMM